MRAKTFAATAASALLLAHGLVPRAGQEQEPVKEYKLPFLDRPHDVAPASDGGVWYTAQVKGALGHLDPATGKVTYTGLGPGSRPHGVIAGPDGAAWVTDGGLNAILRVAAPGGPVTRYPLPREAANADLNTATFDASGVLWFTGQNGLYGSLDPRSGRIHTYQAPRGAGPYGITATPDGSVFYASLAGDYVGEVDPVTGTVTVLDPGDLRQGTRRIWSDSHGMVWVSGWDSGNLIRLDPRSRQWEFYRLPGEHPRPYAVYVDERDKVWVSDWGSNSLFLFDPGDGSFSRFPLPTPGAEVRQILGRPGELWGAESGKDRLFVIRLPK